MTSSPARPVLITAALTETTAAPYRHRTPADVVALRAITIGPR